MSSAYNQFLGGACVCVCGWVDPLKALALALPPPPPEAVAAKGVTDDANQLGLDSGNCDCGHAIRGHCCSNCQSDYANEPLPSIPGGLTGRDEAHPTPHRCLTHRCDVAALATSMEKKWP